MNEPARIGRVYDFPTARIARVEIHERDCECPACAPYLQPASEIEPPLTLREIGNRVWLGLAIGTVIAFAYDAHGAWAALRAAMPW